MVSLSVDTSEVVHLLRSPRRTTEEMLNRVVLSGDVLIMSPLVRHELVSGALSSAAPERRVLQLEELLVQFTEVDFTPEDASESGRVRAMLRQRGTPIGDIDTLIAGQALARGWTVVTRNVRHFGRVEGLPLIDWAEGPDPLPPARIAERVAQED